MKLRLFLILTVIVAGVVLVAMRYAPQTSSIELASCMQSEAGDCIRFPIVTGETLTGETVTLPDFFTGEYNLVIVPFDREQQEGVVEWLPFAQTLQAEYAGLNYYSVGALPDLPGGVRLLISGGMSLAVEADVREVAVLLYLEDQQAFADALNVDSLDQMQLLILDAQGDVVWQTAGAYTEDLADQVRGEVASLLAEA